MLERLKHMPPGTVGFRIDGDVEGEEYREILVPALKAAVESGRGLRALYLIEDLDDLEDGKLWEDTKLGYDLLIQHHGEWKRSAIVTDIEWMARASKLFLWLFPGEARLFRTADLAAGQDLGRQRLRGARLHGVARADLTDFVTADLIG